MSSIKIKNISKNFGKKKVLKNINIEIQDGELIVILGPSGCGKTTLLNIIAGLEKENEGQILINDNIVKDYSPSERNIGFVFQNYSLYPNKTVFGNLAFALKFKSIAEIKNLYGDGNGSNRRGITKKIVMQLAEKLQISDILNSKVSHISGGQGQRVAIGRSLIKRPTIYLFDEPLSNLDATLKISLREEIKQLHRELKSTIVYVTHDQTEAMTLADRIVVMNNGEILQTGTPQEIYENPVDIFIANFIGSPPMNLLKVNISDNNGSIHLLIGDGKIIIPPLLVKKFDKCKNLSLLMGIRPEYFNEKSESDIQLEFQVMITEKEFFGYNTLLNGEIFGTNIKIIQKNTMHFKLDKKYYTVDFSKILWFDSSNGTRLNI